MAYVFLNMRFSSGMYISLLYIKIMNLKKQCITPYFYSDVPITLIIAQNDLIFFNIYYINH